MKNIPTIIKNKKIQKHKKYNGKKNTKKLINKKNLTLILLRLKMRKEKKNK